ncbi:MAG: thioredoxin family protein [Trichococcus flocculiformis]|jgi:small redox-active disulfide protein 2|uniref:Redox-active disulphide protein 2 n=5 Tax=root TaxID=1 RepID=A0AB38BHG5_9LACT|nr:MULTISPECIES: thioredoxin family protein [Trichococcus]MBP6165206.1 TM0996/MTH895 family glutaredoxin-like protein [Trichococcus sp.]OUL09897.1 thioredoxin family protein [Sedimentibacter sp. SX930]MBP6246879.1 TM0996/MTH895 family glutaredoxin-like protein [Trichococcus sp.]MBP7128479.1 TM0996/MTH895 family glutaredoxin-like protein [Trichococcus sp.]MBP9594270.1 TM0996/MTH895 family glutaredoxin-like protein [Trichococcus sp.]
MEIKILGIGCKNCVNLAKNTEEALKELGMEATITKVTDMKDIAKYGIMRTPGLVIDEKVVSYGKVASTEEITELLKK